MKLNFKLLYAAIFSLCILPAKGYDLVVTMEVAETRAKIFDLTLSANYPDSYAFISQASKNEADSTYCFKGLPNERILVMWQVGDNVFSEEVPEPIDSLKVSAPLAYLPNALREVVVTGSSSYMTDEKIVFIPTQKEKKISADGSSLLRNMAIGALNVSPVDNSITTSSGEQVQTFIDYLPATETDVANIRTSDVARVEIFDYPGDPRFGDARHVVNFVMVKYEYGGYTKANADQQFVYDSGNYSAYSKLAYKKMTYDVGVNYVYSKSKHFGEQSNSIYDFGSDRVSYEKIVENSLNETRSLSGFIRAVYQSKNSVISNTVNVSSYKTPDNYSTLRESFDSPAYSPGENLTNSDASDLSFAWAGNYQFFLPKEYTLIISPDASYGKNKSNYSYGGVADSEIRNDVEEDAWNANVNASLRKMLGSHSVTLSANSGIQGNDMDYAGTTPSAVDARRYFASARFMADLRFGKFSIMPSVRLGFVKDTFGNLDNTEFSPHYFVSADYFINGKNKLSMWSELYYMTVPVNQMGPNVQIQNQIDAIKGNPDLKPSIHNTVFLQYTYFPVNDVFLSAYGGFRRDSRQMSFIYEPENIDSRTYMVRTRDNEGFNNSLQYGASASVRLFNKSLSLMGSFNGNTQTQHGEFRYKGTNLGYSFQVNYSYSNVYVLAYYSSKTKSVFTDGSVERPDVHGFQVGWGNGNLNISGTAYNPFSSSYKHTRRTVHSTNYDKYTQSYSPIAHRVFNISVTYSFSYGKKVERSSESSGVSGVQSGILK